MSFYDKKETYDIPSTSGYYKFEDGDNVFRILGAFSEKTAIQGLEYWKTEGNKRSPIRLRKNKDGTFPNVPVDQLELNKFGQLDFPKYFWALPVWNYQEKKVQILEITQKTILKNIQKFIENVKWGDPREYDFIVTKGKEGDKTIYTVTNNPKEKLEADIIPTYKGMDINMDVLFTGGDPFAGISTEDIDSEAVES